jgi:hypothetical protein
VDICEASGSSEAPDGLQKPNSIKPGADHPCPRNRGNSREVRTVSKGGFASTLPLVNIYELDGGKLRRIRVYNAHDAGLRAAGLRE